MNKFQIMFAAVDILNDILLKKADGKFTMEEFNDTFMRVMRHLDIMADKSDMFAFESQVSGDMYIRISNGLIDKLAAKLGVEK